MSGCISRAGVGWWVTFGLLAGLLERPGHAQGSQHALRFFGTGVNQQDRVRIPIDDDVPGNQSQPADVGAGSFTIDFWVRGMLADNATSHAGGDVETAGLDWIYGNVVVDRDVWGGTERDFGISIAGGFVRFGTGRGDPPSSDADHTLEGNVNVLDGIWHHVACTRDVATGVKRVFVDGELDHESSPFVSTADLSYPDAGVPGQQTPWGAYLVVGAEKHDAGPSFPSFEGSVDELRVWNRALSRSQILTTFDRVVAPSTPGLVAAYRFEEGGGTTTLDGSGKGGAAGTVIAGQLGNGQWTSYAQNPDDVAPIAVGPLPPGFRIVLLTNQLHQPTCIDVAPDGRVFIGERDGRVRIVKNDVLLAVDAMHVDVDVTNGERGVLGMALHPHFDQNGWLYLFRTTTEPRDVVSRFNVTGDTGNPASEQVVWQNDHLAADFHHSGCLRFSAGPGHGHELFISVGDQLSSGNAQTLTNFDGKILRIEDDGGVPATNPFVGVPGAKGEIFAWGFRNPFRMTVDAATGELFVGEVGGNVTQSWEELNLVLPGANHGWPYQEAEDCFVSDCSPYQGAIWSYQHDDPDYYLLAPQGSITAGPVYRGTQWPSDYGGDVLVGDYSNRNIRRLMRDASGVVIADPEFLPRPFAGTIVDLAFGPDGHLYFVTFGNPSGAGLPDAAALYRVEYSATGNVPPVVQASATPGAGLAPLTVQFSSAGTIDPDQGPSGLAYAWDFGDGSTSNQKNPSHQYVQNGKYTAVVEVADGADATSSAPIEIRVGASPAPMIVTPAAGAAYAGGQVVRFSGTAFDPEDGVLPPAAFSWRVLLHHHEHAHPFAGPFAGVSSGNFTVPDDGHPPGDTFLELELTVSDSDGLDVTTSRSLSPQGSSLAFGTIPSGVPLELDGEPFATPGVYEGLVGFQHEVAAPEQFTINGVVYAFACWSNGQPRTHLLATPAGGLNLTAVFAPVTSVTTAVAIPAANRNAEFTAAAGQQFQNQGDANALCMGRDANHTFQTGLEFPLALPQGATIVSAKLRVTAAGAQAGMPMVALSAYDVASAPPFVPSSSTPIASHAPLGGASIAWIVPPFVAGQLYESPNLKSLVQEVVDRPDWQSGQFFGLVIDGTSTIGSQYRCFRNFASGQPAGLEVSYVLLPASGGPCSLPCGMATYGQSAGGANVLSLVGTGSTEIGDVSTLITSGIEAPGIVYTLVADQPFSAPLEGGTLLVDPSGFFFLIAAAAANETFSWNLPILNNPAYVGISLQFQSAATAPSQPFGLAFSNGLAWTICPTP